MFHALDGRRLPVAAASLLLLAAMTGCGSDSTTSSDDGHDHGSETIQVTAWSPTHEVFIEHPHLIADVERTMLIFVTDLQTAGPLGEGGLTLNWIGEGEGDQFVRLLAEPVRAGLFEFVASLPVAGHWTLEITPDGAAEPVVVEDIHVAANHIEALHHHGPAIDPDDEVITLSKERQWRLAFTGTEARYETFTHQVHVAATVQAPPDRRVTVTTPVAGRVAPAPGCDLPMLGDMVAAGDHLLAIRVPLTGDSAALAGAEADLVQKRQDLQLAEAELERARTLFEAEAAPRRRVEEAEADVTAARAAYEAARRLVAGDSDGDAPQRILRAPISGMVVAMPAGPGQYVEAGAEVMVVLDPSVVWVRGMIPESDLVRLSTAPLARVASHGDMNTVCEIEDARLIYFSPEIDPISRTADVIYAFDNFDGHLRVGQSLGLRLATQSSVEGLVIPSAALVDEHGRPVVYVQIGGESFIKRNVIVGGDDGVRSLITSGLSAGERVAVNAAWAVKLAGADSSVPAHGHTH